MSAKKVNEEAELVVVAAVDVVVGVTGANDEIWIELLIEEGSIVSYKYPDGTFEKTFADWLA